MGSGVGSQVDRGNPEANISCANDKMQDFTSAIQLDTDTDSDSDKDVEKRLRTTWLSAFPS